MLLCVLRVVTLQCWFCLLLTPKLKLLMTFLELSMMHVQGWRDLWYLPLLLDLLGTVSSLQWYSQQQWFCSLFFIMVWCSSWLFFFLNSLQFTFCLWCIGLITEGVPLTVSSEGMTFKALLMTFADIHVPWHIHSLIEINVVI